ncbi:hypothetical protein GZL_04202 [Streptomyces sp. 769]|nr:hypothetical protein GZL_04202 [Streptomyces sp. 769]
MVMHALLMRPPSGGPPQLYEHMRSHALQSTGRTRSPQGFEPPHPIV